MGSERGREDLSEKQEKRQEWRNFYLCRRANGEEARTAHTACVLCAVCERVDNAWELDDQR